ncbi:MAG: hypothetical protein U9N73_12905, partial [Candidatus Auribacterota bacterium]|nr:hypothetical protein [Candidatus Auribacterota bacterium]
RKKAEDDLRIHYIIAEIVRKEKIEADRESIAGELGRLARQKGVTPGEIRRELEESGRIGTIIDGILRRKVLDFLIEKAEIKEKA